MGRRNLQERLERLERRIPQPSDQEERERRTELYLKHFETWSKGGKFEEVPEAIRDAQMWAYAEEYGPVYLELVWEGSIEGREVLLSAGVDFSLVERSSSQL
jgi:hypothetical protein